MGRTACTEPQCLYKGALYFLYFNKLQLTDHVLYGLHSLEVLWIQSSFIIDVSLRFVGP